MIVLVRTASYPSAVKYELKEFKPAVTKAPVMTSNVHVDVQIEEKGNVQHPKEYKNDKKLIEKEFKEEVKDVLRPLRARLSSPESLNTATSIPTRSIFIRPKSMRHPRASLPNIASNNFWLDFIDRIRLNLYKPVIWVSMRIIKYV
ncbi:unnamed protein product [Clavelina lepadiformis]|uniref:Uncharacterized protein n=1 Tax=Clavelina lepadiformis TaxID=159417 RepID=A0ABP0FAN7_CLALP